MLDIVFVRNNKELVKAGVAKKQGQPGLIDTVLELDQQRRDLLAKVQEKQSRLNRLSEEIAKEHGGRKISLINEAGPLSEAIKKIKPELDEVEQDYVNVLLQIPNLPQDDVPEGKDDHDNVELRREGEPPVFDFEPKNYDQLTRDLELAEFDQATKISGNKFFYLKGQAVLLEMGILRYALDKLYKKGFTPLMPPDLVKYEAMVGAGHFPPDEDAYKLPEDNLYLAGTAEVGLANFHANQALPEEVLPLRYAGYSACFRREAGAYGKKGSGLYRIHQFHKIEMFSLVRPEDSDQEHALLQSISEELLQELGLHYRVVLNCGGDLGMPQAKKWDIECYFPADDSWGETHSCSNDTDYQARRLNIKIKRSKKGETETARAAQYVHTLNNTAFASPRILLPILEQFQQADGSVKIPKVLVPYIGFEELRLSND